MELTKEVRSRRSTRLVDPPSVDDSTATTSIKEQEDIENAQDILEDDQEIKCTALENLNKRITKNFKPSNLSLDDKKKERKFFKRKSAGGDSLSTTTNNDTNVTDDVSLDVSKVIKIVTTNADSDVEEPTDKFDKIFKSPVKKTYANKRKRTISNERTIESFCLPDIPIVNVDLPLPPLSEIDCKINETDLNILKEVEKIAESKVVEKVKRRTTRSIDRLTKDDVERSASKSPKKNEILSKPKKEEKSPKKEYKKSLKTNTKEIPTKEIKTKELVVKEQVSKKKYKNRSKSAPEIPKIERRGRPRKSIPITDNEENEPKSKHVEQEIDAEVFQQSTSSTDVIVRKRGRPRKSELSDLTKLNTDVPTESKKEDKPKDTKISKIKEDNKKQRSKSMQKPTAKKPLLVKWPRSKSIPRFKSEHVDQNELFSKTQEKTSISEKKLDKKSTKDKLNNSLKSLEKPRKTKSLDRLTKQQSSKSERNSKKKPLLDQAILPHPKLKVTPIKGSYDKLSIKNSANADSSKKEQTSLKKDKNHKITIDIAKSKPSKQSNSLKTAFITNEGQTDSEDEELEDLNLSARLELLSTSKSEKPKQKNITQPEHSSTKTPTRSEEPEKNRASISTEDSKKKDTPKSSNKKGKKIREPTSGSRKSLRNTVKPDSGIDKNNEPVCLYSKKSKKSKIQHEVLNEIKLKSKITLKDLEEDLEIIRNATLNRPTLETIPPEEIKETAVDKVSLLDFDVRDEKYDDDSDDITLSALKSEKLVQETKNELVSIEKLSGKEISDCVKLSIESSITNPKDTIVDPLDVVEVEEKLETSINSDREKIVGPEIEEKVKTSIKGDKEKIGDLLEIEEKLQISIKDNKEKIVDPFEASAKENIKSSTTVCKDKHVNPLDVDKNAESESNTNTENETTKKLLPTEELSTNKEDSDALMEETTDSSITYPKETIVDPSEVKEKTISSITISKDKLVNPLPETSSNNIVEELIQNANIPNVECDFEKDAEISNNPVLERLANAFDLLEETTIDYDDMDTDDSKESSYLEPTLDDLQDNIKPDQSITEQADVHNLNTSDEDTTSKNILAENTKNSLEGETMDSTEKENLEITFNTPSATENILPEVSDQDVRELEVIESEDKKQLVEIVSVDKATVEKPSSSEELSLQNVPKLCKTTLEEPKHSKKLKNTNNLEKSHKKKETKSILSDFIVKSVSKDRSKRVLSDFIVSSVQVKEGKTKKVVLPSRKSPRKSIKAPNVGELEVMNQASKKVKKIGAKMFSDKEIETTEQNVASSRKSMSSSKNKTEINDDEATELSSKQKSRSSFSKIETKVPILTPEKLPLKSELEICPDKTAVAESSEKLKETSNDDKLNSSLEHADDENPDLKSLEGLKNISSEVKITIPVTKTVVKGKVEESKITLDKPKEIPLTADLEKSLDCASTSVTTEVSKKLKSVTNDFDTSDNDDVLQQLEEILDDSKVKETNDNISKDEKSKPQNKSKKQEEKYKIRARISASPPRKSMRILARNIEILESTFNDSDTVEETTQVSENKLNVSDKENQLIEENTGTNVVKESKNEETKENKTHKDEKKIPLGKEVPHEKLLLQEKEVHRKEVSHDKQVSNDKNVFPEKKASAQTTKSIFDFEKMSDDEFVQVEVHFSDNELESGSATPISEQYDIDSEISNFEDDLASLIVQRSSHDELPSKPIEAKLSIRQSNDFKTSKEENTPTNETKLTPQTKSILKKTATTAVRSILKSGSNTEPLQQDAVSSTTEVNSVTPQMPGLLHIQPGAPPMVNPNLILSTNPTEPVTNAPQFLQTMTANGPVLIPLNTFNVGGMPYYLVMPPSGLNLNNQTPGVPTLTPAPNLQSKPTMMQNVPFLQPISSVPTPVGKQSTPQSTKRISRKVFVRTVSNKPERIIDTIDLVDDDDVNSEKTDTTQATNSVNKKGKEIDPNYVASEAIAFEQPSERRVLRRSSRSPKKRVLPDEITRFDDDVSEEESALEVVTSPKKKTEEPKPLEIIDLSDDSVTEISSNEGKTPTKNRDTTITTQIKDTSSAPGKLNDSCTTDKTERTVEDKKTTAQTKVASPIKKAPVVPEKTTNKLSKEKDKPTDTDSSKLKPVAKKQPVLLPLKDHSNESSKKKQPVLLPLKDHSDEPTTFRTRSRSLPRQARKSVETRSTDAASASKTYLDEYMKSLNYLDCEKPKKASKTIVESVTKTRPARSRSSVRYFTPRPIKKKSLNITSSDSDKGKTDISSDAPLLDEKDIKDEPLDLEQDDGEEFEPMIPYQKIKKETFEFNIGDIAWAKMATYPYWPCLITEDPDELLFSKPSPRKSVTMYHVRFYADRGRRAWVDNIIPFQCRNDLNKLFQIGIEESGSSHTAHNYLRECYKVKNSQIGKWNAAVKEAEAAKNSLVPERLKFFEDLLTQIKEAEKLRRRSLKQKKVVKESSDEFIPSREVSPVDSNLSGRRSQRKRPARDSLNAEKPPIKQKKLDVEEIAEIKVEEADDYFKLEEKLPVIDTIDLDSDSKDSKDSRQSSRIKIKLTSHTFLKQKRMLLDSSQSDTESKTSNSSLSLETQHELFKRNKLFQGVRKDKVCHFCEEGAESGKVLKCKGSCNGFYHFDCAEKMLKKLQADLLTKETRLQEILEKERKRLEKEEQALSESKELEKATPSTSKLTLEEQIDAKMKEVMSQAAQKESYDSSSESETPKNKPPSTGKKVVQHVTADNVIFGQVTLPERKLEDDVVKPEEPLKKVLQNEEPSKVVGNKTLRTSLGRKSFGTTLVKSVKAKNPAKKVKVKHVTADDVTISSCSDSQSEDEIKLSVDDFRCGYCILNLDPYCLICRMDISKRGVEERVKCSSQKCERCYHKRCLKMWPQTRWSHKDNVDTFICPSHGCQTCSSDDPCNGSQSNTKLAKCLRCPATYHNTSYCIPAGTVILSMTQIICQRHYGEGLNKRNYQHVINSNWCFICSNGGDLTCCEYCPTSVHAECLPLNLTDDNLFICEDCESGRYPLYDEIVWVKLGNFRWWPALILFPNDVPNNVMNLSHVEGEFVVKFYGTYDHYWVARGRTFIYQAGDTGNSMPSNKKMLNDFSTALEEAAAAHKLKTAYKQSKEATINNGIKPPPFVKIKTNKPVGNVRMFDANLSNVTSCNCDPNETYPCGPDSNCINRLLLTECNPITCPAENRCNNQRFEKRQYPTVEPHKTLGRGWGLRTLVPLSKGDFVIEYVGELIDVEEYQRRVIDMHKRKDENYYFLTIDANRLIDAGPKGNVARFMNHSCQPNCETQKWTVNGDTRIGLFASQDIPAESELTFNYNLECIGTEKKVCRCGAPNCSGFIGEKANKIVVPKVPEEKKPRKSLSKLKKKRPKPIRTETPETPVESPCFVCGESGDVSMCNNKLCTKFYHLKCVYLESWPEGSKWVCPCHHCNFCTKRTIRCCTKCTNAYCPPHAEGNIRYDKTIPGFLCSEHDVIPDKIVDPTPTLKTATLSKEEPEKSQENLETESIDKNNETELDFNVSSASTPLKKAPESEVENKAKDLKRKRGEIFADPIDSSNETKKSKNESE